MSIEASARRQFASDNYSGICPEALAAMAEANEGHEVSYGDDTWTAKAANLIRDVFETNCEVFFVFNGTSANSLSLASLCQSYHSILCHELAHVETSECGAPEFFANGTKVLLLPGADGKIEPEAIEPAVNKRTDIHYPKAARAEPDAGDRGRHGLFARRTASADRRRAALRLCACTWTARGLPTPSSRSASRPRRSPGKRAWTCSASAARRTASPLGEAVVFFNPELAREFDYRCKQGGQLASKMRFLSAPWVGHVAGRRLAAARPALQRHGQAAGSGDSPRCPASRSRTRSRPTRSSPGCRRRSSQGMHQRGWKFYTHVSPRRMPASCAVGTRRRKTWMPLRRTWPR